MPLLVVVVSLVGCKAPMTPASPSLLARGELGEVRQRVYENRAEDRGDRAYLLDRMRAASLTLADGYPASADAQFREVYEVLRTAGINADKTVSSRVLYEGVRVWKGEPFEQALALSYVAMTQASLGSWDNARAATDNALFSLRDFGKDDTGGELDAEEIARRAIRYEEARDRGLSRDEARREAEGDYFETQYVPRESDFALGYLLAAVSNRELGRADEAAGQFRRVVELDRKLADLVAAFERGDYNTVLVVGYGLGPRKVAYGPDRSLARFVPRTASNRADLALAVSGSGEQRYTQVTDVNAMARDHRWTNFEQVRAAKSAVGRALTVAGAGTAIGGAAAGSPEIAAIGAGVAVLGALARAGSRADTRYADTFPQRYYAVPLRLADEPRPITLEVAGDRASRLVLHGLRAPGEGEPTTLRYVRLPGGAARVLTAPIAWASSDRVYYTTPYQAADVPVTLPLALGGRDARPPSSATTFADAPLGPVAGFTPNELRNLYRDEGLTWTIQDHLGWAPRHALEGGPSLLSPVPGSTGYTRLFAQDHPPYRPTTSAARRLAGDVGH